MMYNIPQMSNDAAGGFLARAAEARIGEAVARGEFRDLPGAGKPLPEEGLSAVPEELRAAYRVLKNAGYLPPEAQPFAANAAQLLNVAGVREPQQSRYWRKLAMLSPTLAHLQYLRQKAKSGQ